MTKKVDTTPYADINRHLLASALVMAPTGRDFRLIEKQVNSIRWQESDHDKEKAVTHYLLSMMLDGVQHGNWPATIEALNKK